MRSEAAPPHPNERVPRRHLQALGLVWLALGIAWMLPAPRSWRTPHRAWEAVRVSGVVDKTLEIETRTAPFVPHARWEGTATGDLAFMFDIPGARAPRHQVFTVDEWGFRNPPGTAATHRDVVVVGTSFTVGSGVSDDETLTGRLRDVEGIAATNCGGLDLQGFLRDPRWQERPPAWVVDYLDESTVRMLDLRVDLPMLPLRSFASRTDYERWIVAEVARQERQRRRIPHDGDATGGTLGWLPGNDAQRRLQEAMASRDTLLDAVFAPVVPRVAEALDVAGFYHEFLLHHDRTSGLLFYTVSGDRYFDEQPLMAYVHPVASAYARAARLLRRRGVQLLVLICPNKEAVYHERVPGLENANPGIALRALIARLKELGVETIDSWELIDTARREHPDRLLFLADDTHPTPFLQAIFARAVAQVVR